MKVLVWYLRIRLTIKYTCLFN